MAVDNKLGESMADNQSSIIDNREENTLLLGLQRMGSGGKELLVATAFFSLDALLLMADTLGEYTHIRLLFGDEANPKQRRQLLDKLALDSERDLLEQREKCPLLSPLQKAEELFKAGVVEARCYTARKFHAKAYLAVRPTMFPDQMAVLGSGNFTRPGLLENIELNVILTTDQTAQLKAWYDERWAEAAKDVVTEDVLDEIRRHLELWDPYYLYLKALYTWGLDRQGLPTGETTRLLKMLDKHQEDGYLQALKIIEKQNGVMVCDGVGLGKSFIALALMEHYLREGKKILLVAPKNILDNSWDGYLEEYLSTYREPFDSINEKPMTEFGFDLRDPEVDAAKLREIEGLAVQADVVFIDESHNFRTTAANRYKNLYGILAPSNGSRKKVIMLTATPINTAYQDISAQLALVTHDSGSIGGYNIAQIKKYASSLDKDRDEADSSGQLSLAMLDTPSKALNKVLELAVIQRSRKTCKELSRAVGKPLRFPKRHDPQCVEYVIGPESEEYRKLIEFADRVFRPGIAYIDSLRKALEKAKLEGKEFDPTKFPKGPSNGLKLAAFLPAQYRLQPEAGEKQYTDEVHLAGLVFANALKQLESSPPAFQGIIQSLGTGLIARLRCVFGDDAAEAISPHVGWMRTPLFQVQESETNNGLDPDIADEGDTLDASGDEVDEWVNKAIQSRGLQRKLADFTADKFDVKRWKANIVSDLGFLQQVHEAILRARKQPDPKLDKVCPVILADLERKRRVLVFTQSRRTAEYLERELRRLLKDHSVARIDSRIEGDLRKAIVFAFCPFYNPDAYAQSVPKRIDVLISTDVLSEGVNLQEAGAILNYDIHWNPVRLIQRIGRVDRRLDEDDLRPNPEFAIYNVLPPKEIEKIIKLVSSVERRTLKISRALGIDVSFFKSTDPAGTLKEFNAQYEGEMKSIDLVATQYARHFDKPDTELAAVMERIPLGAFGVWEKAPQNGLFALFTMQPTDKATDADKRKYEQVIGRPVFALEQAGYPISHDAGAILNMLSKTAEGEHSGVPSDEQQLSTGLTRLKNSIRQQFADVSLPGTIVPKLVCWMELRKGGA